LQWFAPEDRVDQMINWLVDLITSLPEMITSLYLGCRRATDLQSLGQPP
jgi:hypothetical protein